MNTYKIYLRLKGKLTNVHEQGETTLEAIARAYKSIPKAEFVEIKLMSKVEPTVWSAAPFNKCYVCGELTCSHYGVGNV